MNQPASLTAEDPALAWVAYVIAAGSALTMLCGLSILVCFFSPFAWILVLGMQFGANGERVKAHIRRARQSLGAHVLLGVVAFGLSAVLIFYMAGLSPQSIQTAVDIIKLEGIGIIFTEPFWGTVLNDYAADETRSVVALFAMLFGVPILGTLIGCIVGLVSLIRLILSMQKLGDDVPP